MTLSLSPLINYRNITNTQGQLRLYHNYSKSVKIIISSIPHVNYGNIVNIQWSIMVISSISQVNHGNIINTPGQLW